MCSMIMKWIQLCLTSNPWCLCDFFTQHKAMVMFTSTQTNRTSKWRWTSTSHSWVIAQCNDDVDQYTGGSDGQMTVLLTFSQTYRTWKRWWTRTAHSQVMVQGDGDYHIYCWIIDQCGDVEGLSQLVVNQWWWPGLPPLTVYYRGWKPVVMGVTTQLDRSARSSVWSG
jgi:hypothetical protein